MNHSFIDDESTEPNVRPWFAGRSLIPQPGRPSRILSLVDRRWRGSCNPMPARPVLGYDIATSPFSYVLAMAVPAEVGKGNHLLLAPQERQRMIRDDLTVPILGPRTALQ
jgi:hypothetical protein